MTEHPELDDGLWLSVTDLAQRKGVRKSTISEKVARLVDAGLLTTKPGKGNLKLINVAQYDVAIGEVGDGARESGAATKAANAASDAGATMQPPIDPRLRDEQTRDKAYSADMKYLLLEKMRGNLLVVEEFDAVAEDAAGRIADVIDGLMAQDSDLTAIAIREGENGMRAALKRIVREQRQQVVSALKDMATTARARAKAEAASAPTQSEMPLAPIAE
jgi:hypothetical protein